ncbi:MAG: tetratricopeptide repeat-containing sulfotransferase family protein [Pseudomonadota bacterium]
MTSDGSRDADVWGRQATLLARRGDWDNAARAFERVIALAPEDRRGWEGLARARFAQQDLENGRRLAGEMQARFPDSAFPYLLAGHLHKAYGETDAAIKAYRAALEREPGNGEALFGLVELAVPEPHDPLARQAVETADDDNAAVADRINAGFAAGRILDRAGQYEEAFTRFRHTNDLARRDLARQDIVYRPEQREQAIDRRIRRYPASSFETQLPPLPIDLTPIFVIGMPRSGTTLIEQILASHPEVEAAGELTAAHECESRFLEARKKAGLGGPVNPANTEEARLLEDAREQYVDALFERDLDGPWIVDKMPANFELAGFLRLLFPDAPILHSARDPRATGFSLYSANFGGHEPYYHNLDHLAHYYQQYRRIMAHWQTTLPGTLTDVIYEELVTNPEARIPALLEAAGLPPHDECLDFHLTKRPVLTASHAQVRQPVYRAAIDHWKHYEPWLGPLVTLNERAHQ